jgi:hypothetical protein
MNYKDREEYIAIVIIFVLLIAFSVFLLRQYFYMSDMSDKPLGIINAAILFWTGVAIVIYTRETYKLRETAQKQIEVVQQQVREAQRQTELQQQPFVVTGEQRTQTNALTLITVKNIGNGTAINIRIKDAKAEHGTYSMLYHFPHVIPTLSCNDPPAVVQCEAEQYKGGKQVSSGMIPTDLLPSTATVSTTLRLEFANIENQLYFVEERIARESFEIVGFGPVISDGSGTRNPKTGALTAMSTIQTKSDRGL